MRRMNALLRRGILGQLGSFAPRLALAAGLTALALTGCGPSIDAAAKADIDGRVAALHASGASLPAPSGFVPMPLAAGQWTQHKLVNEKGAPSIITYKVLCQDGDAFLIEMVQDSYTGKMMQQMVASFGNRIKPTQKQIRAFKMKYA